MRILAARHSLEGEAGTHLLDVEINQGRDKRPVRGRLFVTAEHDPSNLGDTKATVAGGCTVCTNIYSTGDKEPDIITIRRSPHAWFVMG